MLNDFEKVVNNLKKNNINVICVKNKEQVCSAVEGLLFPGAIISSGGSVSLNESGVIDLIRSPKYSYLDRNRPGISEREKSEIFKNILGCDFYFCSSNALTENGELINVDGFCNRISAISFGPKKVVMIVGKNKIVKDTAEGFLRVKKIAAPLNTKRLCHDTPCNKLGHCISLEKNTTPGITEGCCSKYRICRNYLVSGMQNDAGRITVVLVGESLGY